MSDIVERLKSRAFRLATKDFNGDGANLAIEAAQAITALTAERDALREALEQADSVMAKVVDAEWSLSPSAARTARLDCRTWRTKHEAALKGKS